MPGKWFTNSHKSLLPDSSSFSKGWHSFIRDSTERKHGFLVTPGTLSISCIWLKQCLFSVRVHGRFVISASRSARFSREKFAIIRLSLWESTHVKENVSKQSSTGFHASQHAMSVPRCLFLQARRAVEAIKSFASMLSGVFRESSRIVCFLDLKKNFEFYERTKRIMREIVVVVKPKGNRKRDVWTSSWDLLRCPRFVGFSMTRHTAA